MQLEQKDFNIISGLIFLIFIGYILGEAVVNFLLGINFIFISYLIYKNIKNYKFNYISLGLLGLFYFYLLSLGLFKFENNLFKNFAYIRFIFLALSIMIFVNSENNKKIIYYFLLLLLNVVSLDAIYQSVSGINFLGFENSIERRLTGVFDDEEVLGSFLSKSFLICAILFCLIKKNNSEKLLFYFSSIIIVTATYISAERLAIFAITIFMGVFFILQFKKLIHRFYFVILSILILIFVINTFEKVKINVLAKTLAQIGLNEISYLLIENSQSFKVWSIETSKIDENKNKKLTISNENFLYDKFGLKKSNKNIYSAHYITAKKIWLDNFWFGAGVKSFIENCKKEKYELPDHPYNKVRCSTHPHNIYLQILSEIGILGFIFFILILYYLFIKNINNLFGSNKNILSLLGFIIIFLPLPSGNFFGTWYGSILWIFLGLNFKEFLLKKS